MNATPSLVQRRSAEFPATFWLVFGRCGCAIEKFQQAKTCRALKGTASNIPWLITPRRRAALEIAASRFVSRRSKKGT
jgi:hypothetical protein